MHVEGLIIIIIIIIVIINHHLQDPTAASCSNLEQAWLVREQKEEVELADGQAANPEEVGSGMMMTVVERKGRKR